MRERCQALAASRGHRSEGPKVTNCDVSTASVQSQGYGTHSALNEMFVYGIRNKCRAIAQEVIYKSDS